MSTTTQSHINIDYYYAKVGETYAVITIRQSVATMLWEVMVKQDGRTLGSDTLATKHEAITKGFYIAYS